MSNSQSYLHPDAESIRLIEAYCNGTCSAEEFEQLQSKLQNDSTVRAYYLRYMHLDSALQTYGESAAMQWKTSELANTPTLNWKRHRVKMTLLAVLVAVVAVLLIVRRDSVPEAVSPKTIAKLEQLSGDIRIVGTDGVVRLAAEGSEIRSGETVQTTGAMNSTNLVYPDGSRLTLMGDTQITCRGPGSKLLELHRGTLFASIVPQSDHEPMRIITPTDRLDVLGTRFMLDANNAETDMSVIEGRVLLTRLSDGQSIEVPAGQRIVSRVTAELALESIPETSDQWSEDFERGLPEGWGLGKPVDTGLPADSKGAVKATGAPGQYNEIFNIVSQEEWAHGLFAVHADTHLHFTLKMQDPGWFNILILTRTADDNPPRFSGNYIFDQTVWSEPAGAWGTVTIPLTAFRPLPPSPDAFKNAVPIQIVFSSPDRDRGLVLDRIWVTRGGPGVVQIKRLETTADPESTPP